MSDKKAPQSTESNQAADESKNAGAVVGSASALSNATPSELEMLRDLIFGNQARDLSRRLTDLGTRLDSTKRELKTEVDVRTETLSKSSGEQVASARRDLNARIDKEIRGLSERLEYLTTDFRRQLQNSEEALNSRLDRLESNVMERLETLREEALQRDEELRQEELTLAAWLDDKKASRHDLAQMLEEIGQRLRGEAAASPDGNNNQ